jgi:hypothetical protein
MRRTVSEAEMGIVEMFIQKRPGLAEIPAKGKESPGICKSSKGMATIRYFFYRCSGTTPARLFSSEGGYPFYASCRERGDAPSLPSAPRGST